MSQKKINFIELFIPDTFSDPRMIWSSIDTNHNVHSELELVLQKDYKDIFENFIGIEKSGSININSSNFLVKTRIGNFILKKVSSNQFKKVKSLCEVDTKLSPVFNRIPKIVTGENSNKFSELNDNFYLLYEKIGSSHYSGEKKEFDMFLDTFMNYQKVVKDKNIRLSSEHQIICAESLLKLTKFYEGNQEIKSEIKEILEPHKNIILSNISSINNLLFTSPSLNAYHIDLHPHNLSISEGELFFLDLDSFQMTSLDRSLGFAFYKLLRQSFCLYGKDLKLSDLINLDKLEKFFKLENINLMSLKVGASYEILRRILIIFEEIIQNNESRWEFILPSHIRGLYEINTIFDNLDNGR